MVGDVLLGRHGEVVDLLARRLDALCDGNVEAPRVVVLRGSSGVGKNRIVREFYDRMRSVQTSAYWPELSGVERTTAAGADAMACRKEIAPRGTRSSCAIRDARDGRGPRRVSAVVPVRRR